MEKNEVEKEYSKLKKKYNLPDYDKLDNDFELSNVDYSNVDKKFLLRIIRRRLCERIYGVTNLLQGVLLPNTASTISMHESKFFTDEERDKIVVMLKKLMLFERKSLVLDTDFDEMEDAKFISEFYNVWQDIKKDLIKVLDVLREGWKKSEKEEFHNYFG